MSIGTTAPLRETMDSIELLRQEFGPSVCDLIFAEIVSCGSIRKFFNKIGVIDPVHPSDRVAIISSYLRRKGSTELIFSLGNYGDTASARRDGTDQTQLVDRVLLERLIKEESDTGTGDRNAAIYDATALDQRAKWAPYVDELWPEE